MIIIIIKIDKNILFIHRLYFLKKGKTYYFRAEVIILFFFIYHKIIIILTIKHITDIKIILFIHKLIKKIGIFFTQN